MGSLRPMITDFDVWQGGFAENPAPNFSYEFIPVNCCMKINEYQQMIIHNSITLDGTLIIDGTLVIID